MSSLATWKKRIDEIKAELAGLGDMRPGTLSQQYNVCGNARCRCKDPENPQKHGPYHQLTYSRKGKSHTEFVRKDALSTVQAELETYSRFRQLTEEWLDLSILIAKEKKKRTQRAKTATKE